MADVYELRFPAIELRQGPNRVIYTFAADGKQLPLFTAVSRLHRDDDAELHGYQRPEVLRHIGSIKRYVESTDPMVPNALVVAFDSRVRFEPIDAESPTTYSRHGTLVIPVDESADDEDKPGWLVDGQQRSAAIRDAMVDEFPVCVSAFITDDEAEQRAQFILVNSTRPLPKGLIYELLPGTSAQLPELLSKKRFPSLLLERLNFDPLSPFYRRIKTPTMPEGIIKDNSILKLVENSLTDGALYRFRDPATGAGDPAPMLELLNNFWSAVSVVFADAWDLPPRRSRLVHGVGIQSLGFVMDASAELRLDDGMPTIDDFVEDLELIADDCAWTGGHWQLGAGYSRAWNDLQNVSRDVQVLANHLLGLFRAALR